MLELLGVAMAAALFAALLPGLKAWRAMQPTRTESRSSPTMTIDFRYPAAPSSAAPPFSGLGGKPARAQGFAGLGDEPG